MVEYASVAKVLKTSSDEGRYAHHIHHHEKPINEELHSVSHVRAEFSSGGNLREANASSSKKSISGTMTLIFSFPLFARSDKA